jgi:serine/threonine protein kinase/tetratricopeptide (TPR) repeat protein
MSISDGENSTAPETPKARERSGRMDLSAGVTLGSFKLVRELGAGGMGVVWEAIDSSLGRRVALKLVRGDRTRSREAVLLLRREAQTMAKLQHPNIAVVYDVDEVDGQLFVAMELLAEGSLRRWLEAGPRSWREIVAAFVAAGRGLAAAHRAGVIHRDFKPDNVLRGTSGEIKVSDFGIAEVGIELEREQPIAGTPAYMAPEQILGRPLDDRADQFSFCVSLWEALTGQRPFQPASGAVSTMPLLLAQITDGRFSEPDADRPSAPGRVLRLVRRGLAADRTERYATIEKLVDALERTTHRRRAWIAAAGASAAAIATVIAMAMLRSDPEPVAAPPCRGFEDQLARTWGASNRRDVRDALATAKVQQASELADRVVAGLDDYARRWVSRAEAACEATEVNKAQTVEVRELRMRCLDSRLVSLRSVVDALAPPIDPATAVVAINPVIGLPALEVCDDVETLQKLPTLPSDPKQRLEIAEIDKQLAKLVTSMQLGHMRESLPLARDIKRAADRVGYSPRQARTGVLLGQLESRLGVGDPDKSLDEALLLADAGRDDDVRFQALIQRMQREVRAAHYADAEKTARAARAVMARVQNAPLREVDLLHVEATMAWNRGDRDRALTLRREALTWATRIHPPNETEIAKMNLNLAGTLIGMSRVDEGIAVLDKARPVLESRLGPDHPDLNLIIDMLGNAHYQQGDRAGALPLLERSLHRMEAMYGADNPRVLYPMRNVIMTLGELGKLDEAFALARHGLAIATAKLPPGHPELGEWYANVADVDRSAGRYAAALEGAGKAVELLHASAEADPSEVARAEFLLGQAMWKMNRDRPKARTYLFAAIAKIRARGEDANVATAMKWLADNHVQ